MQSTSKAKLLIGGAFLAGIVITVVVITAKNPSLTGSVIAPEPGEETVENTSCRVHEQCPVGNVCKTGTCVPAESRFCSQPFMLAESVEDRFIRYTLCENRCVRSGDSAYCE